MMVMKVVGVVWKKKCRDSDFLRTSNTYFRWDRATVDGVVWESHLYDLYFEQDNVQVGGGHRHDIESVNIIFENKVPKFVGVSSHGNFIDKTWLNAPKSGDHVKVVYAKDSILTHAFRFAKNAEVAENPYGEFVMPPLASWFEMRGDGKSNSQMRGIFNSANFGSASFKVIDKACGKVIDKMRDSTDECLPTFDFGLNGNTQLTNEFSEERCNKGFCQQRGSSHSVFRGLKCRGGSCDNLQLTCSYTNSVQVTSNRKWTSSFSEENGGRMNCPNNYMITGISCDGSRCDNLKLHCTELANNKLSQTQCYDSSTVSEEGSGYVSINDYAYPVGMKCSGGKCDNKKIRYCYLD